MHVQTGRPSAEGRKRKRSIKKVRDTRTSKPVPRDLSDEEREMFRKHDFVGFGYFYTEILRLKETKTPDEIKRLAEHDADEKRITEEPAIVAREARESLDRGVSLLLKLIRSRRLTHTLDVTEKGKAEGLRPDQWDEAFEILGSRITDLNYQLIRLSEDNAPKACRTLWFEAKTLCESFIRLAIVRAEEFSPFAEDSLTMPSLRARDPRFTADADAIISAIHLAEKHPSPDIWDNKSRVGAMCHLIVAGIVERIHYARQQYQHEVKTLAMLKEFHETAEKYRGVSVEEKLRDGLHPKLFEHVMASTALPEWGKNPTAWWKGRVLPLVKEAFQDLSKNPVQNPTLWEELKRGGEGYTENDMRRYMEKICKNKFDQIAKSGSLPKCP